MVQAYKVGQKVKGRVIGARQLDGLSVLSLKPLVVEQQVASIAAVVPGSMMTGTIHSIADYGLLVSLAPGIRYTITEAIFHIITLFFFVFVTLHLSGILVQGGS